MEKKVEHLLRERTFNLFSDNFYEDISIKICSLSDNDIEGYVYIIKSVHTSYVKIGIAKDLKKRLNALTHSNGKILLIGYLLCEDFRKIEKKLHSENTDKNVFGEWFSFNNEKIRDIIYEYNFTVINKIFDNKIDLSEHSIIGKYSLELTELEKAVFSFCKENIEHNKVYNCKRVFLNFNNKNISQRKLTSIIIKYAKENELQYQSLRTNSDRMFKLICKL